MAKSHKGYKLLPVTIRELQVTKKIALTRKQTWRNFKKTGG